MQVNIRIRDDLYNELRETAKNNHRTITAELEVILLNALQEKVITKSTIETSKKKPIIGEEAEEPLTPIQKVKKEKQQLTKPNAPTPTPTVDEFIKFLDDEDISPNDTSLDLFDGIKKQVYKNLSLDVFDEAQTIRMNRRK